MKADQVKGLHLDVMLDVVCKEQPANLFFFFIRKTKTETYLFKKLNRSFECKERWIMSTLEVNSSSFHFCIFACFVTRRLPVDHYTVTEHPPCAPTGSSTVNQQRTKSCRPPRRCRCPPPRWLARQTQNPVGQQGHKTGSMLRSLFPDSHTVDEVSDQQ